MKEQATLRGWILALIVGITAVLGAVLLAKEYLPRRIQDRVGSTAMAVSRASTFVTVVSERAKLNGGRIGALDNQDPSFDGLILPLARHVSTDVFSHFKALGHCPEHFYVNPKFVGSQIGKLSETDRLVMIEASGKPKVIALSKGGLPIFEPVQGR